jgi:hypothetical protein
MIYQGGGQGDIGNLLRQIQEEKATSVLANPPAAEPGSPVRAVIQEPLKSPESPGGTRVVSTPAEAVTPGGVQPGVVAPVNGVVAPVPSRPAAPVASVSSNPGGGSPAGNSQGSSSPVASPMSRQVLGTTIKPTVATKPAVASPAFQTFSVAKNMPNTSISAAKQSSVGGYSLGTKLASAGLAAGEKLNPIAGGFGLANLITQLLGIGSWLKPKQAS